MPTQKTLALLCAALLCLGTGMTSPVAAQQKPPAAQPPAAPKPHPDVQALLDTGDALKKEYKWTDALAAYEAARVKAVALQDKIGEAKTLTNIGIVYSETGQPQKALEQHQQALALFKVMGNRAGEARALNNIGNVYHSIGQPQKALEQYQQALPILRAVGDKTGEVVALTNIGVAYANTGQPQKALEQYQQALPLFKTVGDRAGEARALANIGLVYENTGQPHKALEQYQQALAIFRAVGDRVDEARALTNIGLVYANTGEPQKALEQYQQTLPLYKVTGNQAGEAKALANIGNVYRSISQPQQALVQYQQALAILRAVGDKTGEAGALTGIGNVYANTGEPQKALEQYRLAQALYKVMGNRAGEAGLLTNIGNVYAETGQPQKALEQHQQALAIYRVTGNQAGEAAALANIGLVYRSIGQPQKALEPYRQALALFKTVGNRAGEARTLANIGLVYRSIGQPQQALVQYQQALPILRAVGDRVDEARALANIGLVHADTGEPQKALEQYQQALPILRAAGDKTGEANTLANIGLVYADSGQPQQALVQYQQAIALTERYRENIGSNTESKQAYLQTTLDLYHRALALLLQQQPAEAFALAQKVKARSLLDEIKDSKLDLDRDLADEEHSQLIALRANLNRLNKEQVGEGLRSPEKQTPRFKELTTLLAKAQDELADFRADLYRKRPQLALQQTAVTLDLSGTARVLTPDTALIEYVTQKVDIGKGKKLDRTLLFVVTLQNGKPTLAFFPLALSRDTLAEKCNDLYAACSDKSLRAWEGKAAELYHLLIAPAQQQLAGKTRLLVCPDGPLWKTPFAALRDPAGKTLWERYELSFAYSATGAWAAQEARNDPKRSHSTKTLLALANPDFGDLARLGASDGRPIDMPSRDLFLGQRGGLSPLPGTQREADALQTEFPDATLLTGKAAQESTVKQQAGAYRYLHFATHGLFNPNAPMLSFLAMAEPNKESDEDGFLTAREIYDLKLSADLAVLSACNTGRGEQKAGEGIVGLTWALQAAGCPSCVVSQWSVDDAATATLMSDLYRRLKTGKSTASALRAAALKLHNDGVHKHPYYWAAFLLVGKGH